VTSLDQEHHLLGSASKKALTAGRGLRGALALALTAIVTTSAGGCGLLGGDDTSSSSGDGNLEKSKIKVAVMSTIDTGFLAEPFITQSAKTAGTIPVVDTATS
jgi:hypothetical protein